MELMLVVGSARAGAAIAGLMGACNRRGIPWGCFFTNDGVKVLESEAVRNLCAGALQAVACEYSWERFMGDAPCPVTVGSQTNHSAMVAEARRVLSV